MNFRFRISPKISFIISSIISLLFSAFAAFKGIILFFVDKAMDDTFVGGNTSNISISLWLIISAAMIFASFLFFYFIKIKDLKSQKDILTGVIVIWIGIILLLTIFLSKLIYYSILPIIALIFCLISAVNIKKDILDEKLGKRLTETEVNLLQRLAGTKKK
jgi:FtsH-binding integral membrane protein